MSSELLLTVEHLATNLPRLVKEEVAACTQDLADGVEEIRETLHRLREDGRVSLGLDALQEVQAAANLVDAMATGTSAQTSTQTGDVGHVNLDFETSNALKVTLSTIPALARGLVYYASKYNQIEAKIDRLLLLVGSAAETHAGLLL